MKNASVLFNIPELLTIIDNSDSEEYEVTAFIRKDVVASVEISGRCHAD